MIYFGIIFLILFITVFTYLIYTKSKLSMRLGYLNSLFEEEKNKNKVLNSEKIEYIQKTEQLSGQLRYQEHLISEFNKLKAESKESTKAVLFELGSQLSKQLIDIHKKENQETRELSEKNIKETTSKFNSEFERIVNMLGSLDKEIEKSRDTVDIIKNSLLSPSGAGYLAEITLENILKSSGLRSGVDFIMQYSINNQEENSILRPDAIVFLPGDKLMVIDAKASKFLVEDHEDLKKLSKTMNNHLRSLSSKSYADAIRKNLENKIILNNTITLMFLPSEHAVEKLMDADNDFMNKAWSLNIFPVGPSGLMNMLSFAKFQISEQRVFENNLQIIEEVKKLMGSVNIMAEHSSKLGNSISNVVTHYDKFAGSFNRNFLTKAHKLTKMGIEGGLKSEQESLKRLQVFISRSELIEIEHDSEVKNIEENT